MRRLNTAAVVLLVAVAIMPLLHNHPLQLRAGDARGSSSTFCAVCAVAAERIVTNAASLAVPAQEDRSFVAPAVSEPSFDVVRPLSSRAPPTV